MACAMVYWGRYIERFFDVFIQFGAVIDLRELKGRRIGEYDDLVQPSLLDEF